jgi:hypothetical protein
MNRLTEQTYVNDAPVSVLETDRPSKTLAERLFDRLILIARAYDLHVLPCSAARSASLSAEPDVCCWRVGVRHRAAQRQPCAFDGSGHRPIRPQQNLRPTARLPGLRRQLTNVLSCRVPRTHDDERACDASAVGTHASAFGTWSSVCIRSASASMSARSSALNGLSPSHSTSAICSRDGPPDPRGTRVEIHRNHVSVGTRECGRAERANAAPENGPAKHRLVGMALGTNSRLTGLPESSTAEVKDTEVRCSWLPSTTYKSLRIRRFGVRIPPSARTGAASLGRGQPSP